MQIKKLHIDGFGVFHKTPIKGFQKGINVLYGSNEAGKSTLLDFIRFTLFNYPIHLADRRKPLNGGVHGGRIWLENSQQEQLSIYRSGDKKNFELNYQNHKTSDENLYRQLIGNATRDLYQHIFAITLDELVGLENIEESGMEDRIFSMEMGLSGVNFGEFERNLFDQSEEYFKKGGKIQRLSKLVDELNEKEQNIATLQRNLPEYNQKAEERDQLKEKLIAMNDELNHLNEQKINLDNLITVYPKYAEQQKLNQQLTAIGEIKEYPTVLKTQFDENADALKNKNAQLEQVEMEINALHDEIKNLSIKPGATRQTDLLNFIKSNDKLYEEALKEVQSLAEKETERINEKKQIAQQLGDDFDIDKIVALSGTFELQTKADDLAGKLQKNETALDRYKNEEEKLKAEIQSLNNKKAETEKKFDALPIKTNQQRKEATDESIKLDTLFQEAISSKTPVKKTQNKGFLYLFISTFCLGIIGSFFEWKLGSAITIFSVIGLIFYFISQQKSNPIGNDSAGNPLELNEKIKALKEDISLYDKQQAILQELVEKIDDATLAEKQLVEKIEETIEEQTQWKEEWKSILSHNALPTIILPHHMRDFLGKVEKLKLLEKNGEEFKRLKAKAERQIDEVNEKVGAVLSNETIDLTKINQLKIKLDKEEKEWTKKENITENLQKQEKARKRISDDIAQLNTELKTLLSKIGVSTKEDFIAHYEQQEQYKALQKAKTDAELNIKQVCGTERLEEVISSLQETNPSKLKLDKEDLEKNINEKKEGYDQENQRLGNLNSDLEHLVDKTGMYAQQNEQNSLTERLINETKEWMTTKLAINLLEKSKEKYEKERQPTVIQHTRDYFQRITENKYTDLRISLSEKHVSILEPSGNSKTVKELSRGAREQVLLALRLGLIEEYESNAEPLPVVFDDIMVNFDHQRTQIMAQILQAFAAKRQVLFFTCHKQTRDLFKDLGANIIEWQ